MLARLMPLLLHAKAGAISGVVLIGATGALVGVSSQHVVTTVAAEHASASPSASSARHATPEPSESPEHSSSPSVRPLPVTKAADTCTGQTAVLASQIQRVDNAFTLLRSNLMKLRGTRAESALERADASLKRIHQASILALRTSLSCAQPDDEDEADPDTDTETDSETDADAETETETETDEDDADDEAVTPAWITFAATDPAVIADRAIAAMQAAVDAAKSAPAVPARPGRSPEPDRDHD